tara:strand:- start:1175 stop:1540 length:366 start_codon:yes stop_codon:yes gene_type:complete
MFNRTINLERRVAVLEENITALKKSVAVLKNSAAKTRSAKPPTPTGWRGTRRTKNNTFFIKRGHYEVYDTAKMLKNINLSTEEIMQLRWSHGSVESAVKKALLRSGLGKGGSMSSNEWSKK